MLNKYEYYVKIKRNTYARLSENKIGCVVVDLSHGAWLRKELLTKLTI